MKREKVVDTRETAVSCAHCQKQWLYVSMATFRNNVAYFCTAECRAHYWQRPENATALSHLTQKERDRRFGADLGAGWLPGVVVGAAPVAADQRTVEPDPAGGIVHGAPSPVRDYFPA